MTEAGRDDAPVMEAGHPGTAWTMDPATLRPVPFDRPAMTRHAVALEDGLATSTLAVDRAGVATRAALLFAVAGAHGRAAALLERASRDIDDVHDARLDTIHRIRIAQVRQLGGRLQEAASALDDLVDRCRRDDALGALLDFALQHRGKVHFEAGQREASTTCFAEALDLRERKRDAALIASTRVALAAAAR